LGHWAIGLFSNNHFDPGVEASMTAAFVFGPAGAIIGLVAGAMFGKTGRVSTGVPRREHITIYANDDCL
jgi:hypothetical protein